MDDNSTKWQFKRDEEYAKKIEQEIDAFVQVLKQCKEEDLDRLILLIASYQGYTAEEIEQFLKEQKDE